MINRLFLCLYVLFLCSFSEISFSENENFSDVSISCTSKNNAVLLKFEVPKNAKIYWSYAGDAGYNTNIDLSKSLNVDKHKIMWPFPKISIEDGNKKYYYYENIIYIPILVKPIDYSKTTELNIKVEYLLCSEGLCKPEKVELKHYCKIKNEFVEVDSIIPVKQKINDNKLYINIKNKENMLEILSDSDIIDHLILSDAKTFAIKPVSIRIIKQNTAQIEFDIEDRKMLDNKKLYLFSDKFDLPVELKARVKNSNRIIKILLLALIGGFILNFMPCVLPVLSIKLLSIMNAPKRNYKIRAIFTFLGILITFAAISLVSIIFKISGEYFNVGFHFQNYKFVVALSIIITTLISSSLDRINLFRYFEKLALFNINLKYIEDIFIGIISTLIATPCIGPFLSTVLSFAITSENYFANLVVFLFIGIGFGAPYLFLIFSPKIINFIPKSGKLVLIIKKISSFLLVATLMWLLYIISGLLGYMESLLLAMILFVYKFIIESDEKPLKKNKILRICLIFCIITSSFFLPKIYHKTSALNKVASQSIWEEFDENLMNKYISEGEVVLLDITADWCATCKVNKIFLWDRNWTVEFLRKHKIKCLRADITNERLREGGFNSTAIFNFMNKNKIYGIPYNAVFSKKNPDGIVLSVNISFSELKKILLKEIKNSNKSIFFFKPFK